ncbi:MAG: DUF2066 domain-containing protein [Gammaproteobacteria bacterium]
MIRSALFFLLTLTAVAVTGTGAGSLYDAEVRVSGTDDKARESGFQDAMRAVLVKLTGDRNAASGSGAGELLTAANAFVQQYQYRTAAGANGTLENWLWVQFDPAAFNQRLAPLGLSLWRPDRPTTLAWIALEEGGQRRLIGAGDDSPVAVALAKTASFRGLPLLFPLLDLEDQTQVDVDAVWSDMQDAVMQGSERYSADGVLVAMVFQTDGGAWQARWTLYRAAGDERWSTTGERAEDAAGNGVDLLGDVLAQGADGTGLDPQTAGLELTIEGVTDINQYAQIQRYLRSIAAVTDVQVIEIAPQRVRFFVLAPGRTQAVKQSIAVGEVLQPLSLGGTEFRLNPRY